jgi:hypothetical protein
LLVREIVLEGNELKIRGSEQRSAAALELMEGKKKLDRGTGSLALHGMVLAMVLHTAQPTLVHQARTRLPDFDYRGRDDEAWDQIDC